IAAASEAIPSLEQLVEKYRTFMQQGNVDILSFYTAQSALAQKRIDLVKFKQQLIENWIALEIASGQYLPIDSAAQQPSKDKQPGTLQRNGSRSGRWP